MLKIIAACASRVRYFSWLLLCMTIKPVYPQSEIQIFGGAFTYNFSNLENPLIINDTIAIIPSHIDDPLLNVALGYTRKVNSFLNVQSNINFFVTHPTSKIQKYGTIANVNYLFIVKTINIGYSFATINIPIELVANLSQHIRIFAGPGFSYNLKSKKEQTNLSKNDEFYSLANALGNIYKTAYSTLSYGAYIEIKNFFLIVRFQNSIRSMTKGFLYNNSEYYMPIKSSGMFLNIGYSFDLN